MIKNQKRGWHVFYREYSFTAILWAAAVMAWLGIAGLFSQLGFELLQSDAKGYWVDSLNLAAPFHPFHVPGYPLVIGAVRAVTFSLFTPSFYLQAISLASFLISLLLVYEIGKILTRSNGIGLACALLYMLWPMVGLPYVVFPLADSLAMALFLLGIHSYLKNRSLSGSMAWAGALLVHKAMWVFVLAGLLLWLYQSRPLLKKENLLAVFVTCTPLVVYATLGSFYHGSIAWILTSNYQVEVSSTSGLWVMDGLLGTLLAGGLRGWVKGGVVLLVFLGSVFVLWVSIWDKFPGREFAVAIAASVLILSLTLNQYEIWAAVRFSRLLAVPMAAILGSANFWPRMSKSLGGKSLLILLGIALYGSQLFYAWYMTAYFAG